MAFLKSVALLVIFNLFFLHHRPLTLRRFRLCSFIVNNLRQYWSSRHARSGRYSCHCLQSQSRNDLLFRRDNCGRWRHPRSVFHSKYTATPSHASCPSNVDDFCVRNANFFSSQIRCSLMILGHCLGILIWEQSGNT